jgi:hypothetical protein
MASAWDIAGAVVCGPLGLLQLFILFSGSKTMSDSTIVTGTICTLGTCLIAVFCIARLCGAHA